MGNSKIEEPNCFYCGRQPGKDYPLANAEFLGTHINIEDTCEDIC